MSDAHSDNVQTGGAAESVPAATSDLTVPALSGPAGAPTAADLPLTSPVDSPSSPLVRLGGALGIAGIAVGLVLLLVGCAGFPKALVLSYVPAVAGALGLVLALIGAVADHRTLGEDTHILQALFASLMSLAGGLFEVAVWHEWPILK